MPERIGGDAEARLLLEGNIRKSGVYIGGKTIRFLNNRNVESSHSRNFEEGAHRLDGFNKPLNRTRYIKT